MANFNIEEVFKDANIKRIVEKVLKLCQTENTIKALILKGFKAFKESNKEDIYISGFLLGKYVAINDREIKDIEFKKLEEDIKYIG